MYDIFLSFAPLVCAIVIALIIRNAAFALFCGVLVGATILSAGNPFLGFLLLFEGYLIPALATPWNATVILYGSAFGGLLALMQKTGGGKALGRRFVKVVGVSKRKAQVCTVAFGVAMFFDDYFSCLTVGGTMRFLADRVRLAREKLAFIIDSTAAPICLLVPFSTWVIFIVGLLGKECEAYGLTVSPYFLYLSTISLNYYAIIALAGVTAFSLLPISFGPMRRAEVRAQSTCAAAYHDEESTTPQGKRERVRNLAVPLFVLIVLFPVLLLYTGGYWHNGGGLFAAIAAGKGAYSVLIASMTAGGVALAMGIYYRFFTLQEGLQEYISGMQNMMPTYLILLLSWAMASLVIDLKTAHHLSSMLLATVPPFCIPALLFIVAGLIAFMTGSSYGTFSLVIPLVFPIAQALGISLELCIAPVLSGGIFGDHCSPISDTTILSSTASGCDHMDHVATQMPYAMLFALAALAGFLWTGLFPEMRAGGVIISGLVFFCVLFAVRKRFFPVISCKV
jgi:tetracycline resistance efflux pump